MEPSVRSEGAAGLPEVRNGGAGYCGGQQLRSWPPQHTLRIQKVLEDANLKLTSVIASHGD